MIQKDLVSLVTRMQKFDQKKLWLLKITIFSRNILNENNVKKAASNALYEEILLNYSVKFKQT